MSRGLEDRGGGAEAAVHRVDAGGRPGAEAEPADAGRPAPEVDAVEGTAGAEARLLEARIDALDEVTLAVRGFIEASQDLTGRMARRMGVNVNDMLAILFLAGRGPAGAGELADRLGMSRASTSALVDRLERQGLLERVRGTADRRRVSVSTTPAARVAALTAWLPAIDELDGVCRSLPEEERAAARSLLARLAEAMRRG